MAERIPTVESPARFAARPQSAEQLLVDALCIVWQSLPEEHRTLEEAAHSIFTLVESIIDDDRRAGEIISSSDRTRDGEDQQKPIGRSIRNRPSGIERARSRHPNAYRQWSRDEESQLRELFEQRLSVEQIAERLARQPGAVYTRLLKLRLIEQGE